MVPLYHYFKGLVRAWNDWSQPAFYRIKTLRGRDFLMPTSESGMSNRTVWAQDEAAEEIIGQNFARFAVLGSLEQLRMRISGDPQAAASGLRQDRPRHHRAQSRPGITRPATRWRSD
ncbi:MAG TPA: hypothetical protein VGG66_11525 [Rhizomicrobium sp.]